MVVVDGWPLLKKCSNGDLDSLATLFMRLASRVSPSNDSSSEVNSVPWRISEKDWLLEAFSVVCRFLLSQNELLVTEAADTDALRCCALLLGTGGAKVLEENSLNLLSDLVHALSLRAEARTKESAFKRSLCVYILAIVGVELEIHARENPSKNSIALQLSTVCLSEIRRWRQEFSEIEMLIQFLDWRKTQKPTWDWVLYGFVVPVVLGATWHVFYARNGNPHWFRHDFVFYVCIIGILGAIALPTLFSGQLEESNRKINSGLWTLLHMCTIVAPQTPEKKNAIYVSACRSEIVKKDIKEEEEEEEAVEEENKVSHAKVDAELQAAPEVGEDVSNTSEPSFPIEIPNDMSKKIENLIKMMEENSCDLTEIQEMKERLKFARSMEEKSVPVEKLG